MATLSSYTYHKGKIMSDLVGQPSEMSFTVTITRKATGAVETYHMIGTPVSEAETPKEIENVSDTHDLGS
jgi:hypothetical protein